MAAIQTLVDNFDDNSIDSGLWSTGIAAGSSITETGGQLVIAPPVSATGYSYMDSNATYSLVGSSVTLELAGTISTSTGVEQIFEVMIDDNNYIMFFIANTGAGMRLVTAAADDSTYTTRDDRAMRWLRIREASGIIYWESSPDRSSWTVQRSAPSTFSLASVKVRLSCGCWQAVASPGTAIFDNLNVSPTTYRNTAEGQTNGTTLTAANSGGGSGTAFGAVANNGNAVTIYSSDVAMFGARSYKTTASAGGSTSMTILPPANTYCMNFQGYFRTTAASADEGIMFMAADITNGTGGAFSCTGGGTLTVGNLDTPTTFSQAIPVGQWIRMDLSVIVGTTSSNGRVKAQLSYANSFTPFWSYDSGYTINTGTTPFTIASPVFAQGYADNIAWRFNMSDFIPPESSSPSIAWFVA